MPVEINQELGIRISSAMRPQVDWPEDVKTVVHIDASSGTALLLNGYGYNSKGLLSIALRALVPALHNIHGSMEELPEKLGSLFHTASSSVEKKGNSISVINATAIKIITHLGSVVAAYAHVGNNRLYNVDRFGNVSMVTIDGGHYWEKNRPVIYGENSKEIAFLIDSVETSEALKDLLNKYSHVDNYWNYMVYGPAEALGSRDTKNFHVGTISGLMDRLLISSLGVHRSLTAGERYEIVTQESDPAQALVDAAHSRSSTKHFRAAPMEDYAAIVVERVT